MSKLREYMDTDPALPGLRRQLAVARACTSGGQLLPEWRQDARDLVAALDKAIEEAAHPDDRIAMSSVLTAFLHMFLPGERIEAVYLGLRAGDLPGERRMQHEPGS